MKPDVEEDPNHWVLRVEGEALTSNDTMDDISLMWYLSTPDELLAHFDENF